MSRKQGSATFLWMLLCVACLVASGCADAPSNSAQSMADSPRHQVKNLPPVFSDEEGTRVVVFSIRNDSNEPANNLRVERSCSCSDAALNVNKLAPGEVGELRFTLHHRGRWGPQRIRCAVVPEVGEPWTCEVVTHIHQRIRFVPQVVNFGEVSCTQPNKRQVRLEQRVPESEAMPSIEEVSSEAKDLTVSMNNKGEMERRDGVLMRDTIVGVALPPGRHTVGDYFTCVTAKYQGSDGQTQLLRLPVSWRVPAVVETMPSRVLFGLVKKSETVEKKILVKRTDGGSLDEVDVIVPDSERAFQVSRTMNPDKTSFVLRVQLDPSNAAGDNVVSRLTIRVRGVGTGDLQVPLIASIGGE